MEYTLPNMATGYARNTRESLYPNLWNKLVGYWSPEMGVQGNTLIDWTQRNSNAIWPTSTGTPPSWTTGRNGSALNVTGNIGTNNTQAGCIALGNCPFELFTTTAFTVMIWFRTSSYGSGCLFSIANSGDLGPSTTGYVIAESGGFHVGDFFGSGAEYTLGYGSFTITDNKWHCFVMVANPVTSTGYIYLDGVQVSTHSLTTHSTWTSSYTMGLALNNDAGGSFLGRYSDVGIWNRALSSQEVLELASGHTPLQFANPDGWLYSPSGAIIEAPSVFSLTSTLYTPSLIISNLVEPSNFSLISTLYSPVITSFKSVTPSTFNLTSTLYSPSLLISSTTHPSLLTLTATLHQPNIIAPGSNSISFASAIISYNPLIIVSNTNPVKVSIVDVSTPDNPIYTTHSYTGCSNATAVSYNSDLGMSYVSCADGIILEINASSPTSYTINYTGASGNLTSLTILSDFFDVYAGTDYSTGEAVNMYEGSATTVACDVRFSASYQSIFGTQVNTINAQMLSTDIRFVEIINNI